MGSGTENSVKESLSATVDALDLFSNDTDTDAGIDEVLDLLKKDESIELSGKYEIIAQCGTGGCSKVYEGRRLSDDTQIALKLLCLPPGLSEEESNLTTRRFYAEAHVLQKLTEDHSLQCYEYGVYKGTPCYVMEYVNGVELNNYLRNSGALNVETSVSIMRQVLCVLAQAHECGVIHRDIKPENVLVLSDFDPITIRLIDFGIATIQDRALSGMQPTQLGVIRGTPSYMAPELFTGKAKASPESDFYACGLVLLECLTGNIAVPGNSLVQIANKHTNDPLIIPPFIPECLANIINKCCEKDPVNRYHSANGIIQDLDKALPQACAQQTELRNTYYSSTSIPSAKRVSHVRTKVIQVVILIVFMVLGAGLYAFLYNQSNQTNNTEATPAANTAQPQGSDTKTTDEVLPVAAAPNAPVPQVPETLDQNGPAPTAQPDDPTMQGQNPDLIEETDTPTNAPIPTDAILPNENEEAPQPTAQDTNTVADDVKPVEEPTQNKPSAAANPSKPKPAAKPNNKSVKSNEGTANQPARQTQSAKTGYDAKSKKKVDNSNLPLSVF